MPFFCYRRRLLPVTAAADRKKHIFFDVRLNRVWLFRESSPSATLIRAVSDFPLVCFLSEFFRCLILVRLSVFGSRMSRVGFFHVKEIRFEDLRCWGGMDVV